MTTLDEAPLEVLDAYRTCEFATLSRDGTPAAWPTAVRRGEDGTLLLTTSLAFAQKALNVRRDGRVALLFSDPTGSGLTDAPQILVTGRAECPEEVRSGPEGAEDYWRMLFERQPHSRSYVSAPARWTMDWYYLRLLITVTPERVTVRPPLAVPGGPRTPALPNTLVGAEQLNAYASAVLGARDASGAPVLARTRPMPGEDGYLLELPTDCAAVPGPASLLVHRHDDRMNNMHNALVRGRLDAAGDGRMLLVPEKVVEPMGTGRASDALGLLRRTKRSTGLYLERRDLPRPKVRWAEFRELARRR
ncbi:pyridoxamine 5'-phosphate oxidase family protein [Streptomyces sp. NPDC002690]